MVTPEARAKSRGPARPNAASASKKVSAVEPSEADAIVLLCKEKEADFCECFVASLFSQESERKNRQYFELTTLVSASANI